MAEIYAHIPGPYAVARALADLLDDWLPEYLAAIDRQRPDPTGRPTEIPKAAHIRHAGVWRRGDGAPAVVVWPEGVLEPSDDPEGHRWGTVQLAVLLVASARDEDATTLIAQTYADATRAVLHHRPVVLPEAAGGEAHLLVSQDEDYTALDVPERGQIRAGITLTYRATGVYLGRRDGGPPPGATPRPDPKPPWPAGPTVKPGGAQATVQRSSHPMDPN